MGRRKGRGRVGRKARSKGIEHKITKQLSIKARKQEGKKVGKKEKAIYRGTTLSSPFPLAGPLIFLLY